MKTAQQLPHNIAANDTQLRLLLQSIIDDIKELSMTSPNFTIMEFSVKGLATISIPGATGAVPLGSNLFGYELSKVANGLRMKVETGSKSTTVLKVLVFK